MCKIVLRYEVRNARFELGRVHYNWVIKSTSKGEY